MNEVMIKGLVCGDVEYSHKVRGWRYYVLSVMVNRAKSKKGSFDVVPCIISEDQIDDFKGRFVEVTGRFGSWNYRGEDGRRHNKLNVYAKDVYIVDEPGYMNEVTLRAVVVKNNGLGRTPFGVEITDLMVAVNEDNRSDYIPCICWNSGARYADALNVGDFVEIVGQIQSREYVKNEEKRIAYELSVFKIDLMN